MIDEELRAILDEMRQGTAQLRQEMREGFAAVSRRFDAMNHRFDAMDRRFDVTIERLDSKTDLIVEMVLNVDQKLDREAASIRSEMREGFAETHNLIRFTAQGR